MPVVTGYQQDGGRAVFTYEETGAAVVRADLILTRNGGERYEEWFREPAELTAPGRVEAELPGGG